MTICFNMETLQKYEALKLQAAEIEKQLKELAPEVTQIITTSIGQKVETEHGLFYFAIRRKYNYSDKVKQLEAELKTAKKEDEKTVDFAETKVLNFKSN